jgi:hypothetical protein
VPVVPPPEEVGAPPEEVANPVVVPLEPALVAGPVVDPATLPVVAAPLLDPAALPVELEPELELEVPVDEALEPPPELPQADIANPTANTPRLLDNLIMSITRSSKARPAASGDERRKVSLPASKETAGRYLPDDV